MTTLREAAQQALEALEALVQIHPGNMTPMAEEAWNKAIVMLGAALAEPDHIPDAGKMVAEPCEMGAMCLNCQPRGPNGECPDAPQPRRRLTDEEIDNTTRKQVDDLLDHIYEYGTAAEGIIERVRAIARAIERAHGIGEHE